MPLSTPDEVVEEQLADQWDVSIGSFAEIADALLCRTRPFPSSLIEGELIQAFVRPTADGKVLEAFIRRIIPPGADYTDDRVGKR